MVEADWIFFHLTQDGQFPWDPARIEYVIVIWWENVQNKPYLDQSTVCWKHIIRCSECTQTNKYNLRWRKQLYALRAWENSSLKRLCAQWSTEYVQSLYGVIMLLLYWQKLPSGSLYLCVSIKTLQFCVPLHKVFFSTAPTIVTEQHRRDFFGQSSNKK